ncbi:Ig-like domain-containing protein [Flagellimonas taeanensis]|uniref:Ig-like domain-containing protein n=1 Tax=Flagellimonas taeanensis TaxID=1005926 RepID=UPI002E7B9776|nr:Ig-like domain-containing protein [Allomuricauda taeanensis]
MSCSNDLDGPSLVKVEDIELSTETNTISVGETLQLNAEVVPENATNRKIVWSRDNTEIVEVDQNGLVKALAPGRAIVTATAGDGSGKENSVQLTVMDIANTITSFKINETQGVINGNDISITLDSDVNIDALAPVIVHTGNAISPKSGEVVDFSDSVNVPVVYTVTAENGETNRYFVKVLQMASMDLEIASDNFEAGLGEKKVIHVKINPSNADMDLQWSSSDPQVATVDENGGVMGVRKGNVTITATSLSDSRISASLQLTITQNDFVYTVDTQNSEYDNVVVFTQTEIDDVSGLVYEYNYNVDWDNDGVVDSFGNTGSVSHVYSERGMHTIRISGVYPAIPFGIYNTEYFKDVDDVPLIGQNLPLVAINQWGTGKWSSLAAAFFLGGAQKGIPIKVTATDVPDLSEVENMGNMFNGIVISDLDVSQWDTSNVEYMGSLFEEAKNVDPDVSHWDVGKVVDMSHMFQGAADANPDISNWNLPNSITSESTSIYRFFNMFKDSGISNENYEKALVLFAEKVKNNPSYQNMNLGEVPASACTQNALDARDILVSDNGWVIKDQPCRN